MPRLIMLDHSLAGVGSHHYEYAVHVLRAAGAAGREIVVGANVDFERAEVFSSRWRVLPVFRSSAYHEFNVYTASAKAGRMVDLDLTCDLTCDGPSGRWSAQWQFLRNALDWRNLYREHRQSARAARKLRRRRWNVIEECVADCRRFFESIGITEEDVVFVPTLTEFDLVWIARFLKTHPRFSRVPWHLQFHFNFLEGREPDYAEQATRLAHMRRHFQRQLEQIPNDCLRFHATTEQLAAQYNRLEVGPFRCLPYPVNPELKVSQRGVKWPLRVVFAGGIRAEKGSNRLQSLVEKLWSKHLKTGGLQLVVQVDRQDFSLTLPDGRPTAICDSPDLDGLDQQPVVLVRAPLEASQYAKLLRSADIGVFLYDSDRYYTRCSGVLVEMLACGVPVVVPAGTWLSEQIAEPIAAHLESLLQQCPRLQNSRIEDLSSAPDAGLPGGSVGLIAASPEQVPALLSDMAEHYPHYRQTAAAFAEQWVHEHHPRRTIEMLLASAESRVKAGRQAA